MFSLSWQEGEMQKDHLCHLLEHCHASGCVAHVHSTCEITGVFTALYLEEITDYSVLKEVEMLILVQQNMR